MRKFITYLASVCLFALLTECTDSEYKEQDTQLKVLTSQLDFVAAAGTGSIVVETEGSLTASSSAEWCSVSVSKNTVNVSVTKNTEYTNRTAVVKIKSDSKSVNVPVVQCGVRFIVGNTSLNVSYLAGVTKISSISSDLPLSIESKNDWIRASMDGDTIYVQCDENSLYENRTGEIEISAGIVKHSVLIIQEQKPIYYMLLGDWLLEVEDYYFGESVVETLTFTEKEAPYSYDVSGLVIPSSVFQINYNNSDLSLTIANAQTIGTYDGYTLVFSMINSGVTNFSDEPDVLYKGVWNGSLTNPEFTFTDGGTWSDDTVDGIMIDAYDDGGYAGPVAIYLKWKLKRP
ncbi:MAG: hypothetical protein LBG92_08765 [Prevotellaceae bacterium]|jgi:hypothetical protein|nr:hypothetical protein [Prevotellaceae bacterium]